jgi:hypothetical protein
VTLSFPAASRPAARAGHPRPCVDTLDEPHELVALGRESRSPPIPLDVRPLDAAPEAMADLCAGSVRVRVIQKPDG